MNGAYNAQGGFQTKLVQRQKKVLLGVPIIRFKVRRPSFDSCSIRRSTKPFKGPLATKVLMGVYFNPWLKTHFLPTSTQENLSVDY